MEKIEVLEKAGKYLLFGERDNAKIMINEQSLDKKRTMIESWSYVFRFA